MKIDRLLVFEWIFGGYRYNRCRTQTPILMETTKTNLIPELILIAELTSISELILDPIPEPISIAEPIPIPNPDPILKHIAEPILKPILKPIPELIPKPIPENDAGPTIRNKFHKDSELVGIDSDQKLISPITNLNEPLVNV